ncbi:MAG: hypothetical protein GKR89_06150 [Candidatus Latescibacteria bacterium]|nr:hypothetical protein [Candidatus Latescibacterota bacterium]
MHTSSRLSVGDFTYRQQRQGGWDPVDFADFCPGYQQGERVGVVNQRLEDGVLQAGCALLALTTAFYDALRRQPGPFFNYPQHFAFLPTGPEGFCTRQGPRPLQMNQVGGPWSNLDVWPESQWVECAAGPVAMLGRVGAFQITRLFWPACWRPGGNEEPLPSYWARLLRARLQGVYYYGSPTPSVEIIAGPPAVELVTGSAQRLPEPVIWDGAAEGHQAVAVETFMEDMAGAFAPE